MPERYHDSARDTDQPAPSWAKAGYRVTSAGKPFILWTSHPLTDDELRRNARAMPGTRWSAVPAPKPPVPRTPVPKPVAPKRSVAAPKNAPGGGGGSYLTVAPTRTRPAERGIPAGALATNPLGASRPGIDDRGTFDVVPTRPPGGGGTKNGARGGAAARTGARGPVGYTETRPRTPIVTDPDFRIDPREGERNHREEENALAWEKRNGIVRYPLTVAGQKITFRFRGRPTNAQMQAAQERVLKAALPEQYSAWFHAGERLAAAQAARNEPLILELSQYRRRALTEPMSPEEIGLYAAKPPARDPYAGSKYLTVRPAAKPTGRVPAAPTLFDPNDLPDPSLVPHSDLDARQFDSAKGVKNAKGAKGAGGSYLRVAPPQGTRTPTFGRPSLTSPTLTNPDRTGGEGTFDHLDVRSLRAFEAEQSREFDRLVKRGATPDQAWRTVRGESELLRFAARETMAGTNRVMIDRTLEKARVDPEMHWAIRNGMSLGEVNRAEFGEDRQTVRSRMNAESAQRLREAGASFGDFVVRTSPTAHLPVIGGTIGSITRGIVTRPIDLLADAKSPDRKLGVYARVGRGVSDAWLGTHLAREGDEASEADVLEVFQDGIDVATMAGGKLAPRFAGSAVRGGFSAAEGSVARRVLTDPRVVGTEALTKYAIENPPPIVRPGMAPAMAADAMALHNAKAKVRNGVPLDVDEARLLQAEAERLRRRVSGSKANPKSAPKSNEPGFKRAWDEMLDAHKALKDAKGADAAASEILEGAAARQGKEAFTPNGILAAARRELGGKAIPDAVRKRLREMARAYETLGRQVAEAEKRLGKAADGAESVELRDLRNHHARAGAELRTEIANLKYGRGTQFVRKAVATVGEGVKIAKTLNPFNPLGFVTSGSLASSQSLSTAWRGLRVAGQSLDREVFDGMQRELKGSKIYRTLKRAGTKFDDQGGILGGEVAPRGYIGSAWGGRAVVEGIDRAKAARFNALRASIGEEFLRRTPNPTAKDLKQLADYLNDMTGKGPTFSGLGGELATLVELPGLTGKILLPKAILSPGRTGAMARGHVLNLTKAGLTAIGVTKAAGGEVSFDLDDDDNFLKLRLWGGTFDPFKDQSSTIRVIAKEMRAAQRASGLPMHEAWREITGPLGQFLNSELPKTITNPAKAAKSGRYGPGRPGRVGDLMVELFGLEEPVRRVRSLTSPRPGR